MDVEQDVVLAQERADPVADPVLEILRQGLLPQVPVEVAIALAASQAPALEVRDRHEGDLAPPDREAAGLAFGDGAEDGVRPAGLVAVDGPEHDQLRAGLEAAEA